MEAGATVKALRLEARLTQSELAGRMGTSQPAVARLERPGSNPRLSTLERALRALGRRLELRAPRVTAEVDEEQLRAHLRLSPAERADLHDRSLRHTRGSLAGARRLA